MRDCEKPGERGLCRLAAVILGMSLIAYSAAPGQDQVLTVENTTLAVSLDTGDGTLSVLDKRTGQHWHQKAAASGEIRETVRTSDRIEAVWRDAGLALPVQIRVELASDSPEFTISLAAAGELKWALSYPHPFVTESGTYLVVPMNEGISYPVDDPTVEERWLVAYGGHGICMPFWGVTDGRAGHMTILETPDDAAIHLKRMDGRLCVAPK